MTSALVDAEARAFALTSRGVSLLVEAGAGSGKTTLMAGRIVSLLASGEPPGSIAAITFTEAAAGHLASVVHHHVHALLQGTVDVALRPAFPDGPTAAQLDALRAAAAHLDAATITTLHGFAREILVPHPVEANLDPGASVMDARATDEAFEAAFDSWLREALDGTASHGAPVGAGAAAIARLVRDAPDPRKDVKRLRALATTLRDAHPVSAPSRPTVQVLTDAIDALLDATRTWRDRVESHRAWAPAATRDEVDRVMQAVEAVDIAGPHAHRLRTVTATVRQAFVGRAPVKATWENAARDDGVAKKRGEEAWRWCNDARTEVRNLLDALRTNVADAVFADALDVVTAVEERFAHVKRTRAALDFGDLTSRAATLLAERPDVRDRLARRYVHVLVDEFQDTDPVQAEIVWRLTGVEGDDPDWRTWPSRPGARFVVGDPKQSIYAFRGADVETYRQLADAMAADPHARVVTITTNFRSVPAILDFVNRTFADPLDAGGQPGFVALDPRPGAGTEAGDPFHGTGVFTLEVAAADETPSGADEVRDAAASEIAEAVQALLTHGRRADGAPLEPRDVALLAPSASGLDVLEAHLRRRGIVVASQASKGYYRRQIVHDLIALTRALADPTDTLAWAATLRGPLVGVTDEERLDALEHLRATGRPERALRIDMDPAILPAGRVREATERIAPLAAVAATGAPYDVLCDAVDLLDVRTVVALRDPARADGELANVERFLTQAAAYAAVGLRGYARAVTLAWSDDDAKEPDAQPDASVQAVTLQTFHASKGLEWPVVVPVNLFTAPKAPSGPFRTRDGVVQHKVDEVATSGHASARDAHVAAVQRERVRLLYVAATRARERLVLPVPRWQPDAQSWHAAVPWATSDVPPFRSPVAPPHSSTLPPSDLAGADAGADVGPTCEAFDAQSARLRDARVHLRLRAPSHHEEPVRPTLDDEALEGAVDAAVDGDGVGLEEARAAGRRRGVLVHAVMEALIVGDLAPTVEAVAERLRVWSFGDESSHDAWPSVAASVVQAWNLPEVVRWHGRLTAEVDVWGTARGEDGAEVLVHGVADAVAWGDDGRPEAVIDWKSDRDPTEATWQGYREQVRAYLSALGAAEGWIVSTTVGRAERVTTST